MIQDVVVIMSDGSRWILHPDSGRLILQFDGITEQTYDGRAFGFTHDEAEEHGNYWVLIGSHIVAWKCDN